MESNEIQKKIDESYYYDARVKKIECNYFGDEVEIDFNNGERDIKILCEECYKIHFNHIEEYEKIKPLKFYKTSQIPFFLQNIEVEEKEEFYIIKINIHPLYMKIKCKRIKVN